MSCPIALLVLLLISLGLHIVTLIFLAAAALRMQAVDEVIRDIRKGMAELYQHYLHKHFSGVEERRKAEQEKEKPA